MIMIKKTEKLESVVWGTILSAGIVTLFTPAFLSPVMSRMDVKLIKLGILASASVAGSRILYRYRPGSLDAKYTALKQDKLNHQREIEGERIAWQHHKQKELEALNHSIAQAQEALNKQAEQLEVQANARVEKANQEAQYWREMYIRSNAPVLPKERYTTAASICVQIQMSMHQLGLILDCNLEQPVLVREGNDKHYLCTLYFRNQEQVIKYLENKTKLVPVIEAALNHKGGIRTVQAGDCLQITFKPGTPTSKQLVEEKRGIELKKPTDSMT